MHTMKNFCAQTTQKMGFFNKADMLILVGDNMRWISVKKNSASFNQIDKRWIEDYAKMRHVSYDVITVLKMYCREDGFRRGGIVGPFRITPPYTGICRPSRTAD